MPSAISRERDGHARRARAFWGDPSATPPACAPEPDHYGTGSAAHDYREQYPRDIPLTFYAKRLRSSHHE